MKTRCIIVDDEPLARDVVRAHLSNFEDIEIAAECENALEAGKILREKQIDLMFMDIEMPKISGFDFLNDLSSPPKVIIITAYRNYALKGYEFDVVDYLLKPVSFDRFYKAVNKYFKLRQNESDLDLRSEGENKEEYLYLNEDKTIHKIFLSEIQYIESFREYIKVHTAERTVMTKIPISKIEERLKDFGFVRVHKSYIVAASKITAFNAGSVFIGKLELPIGRTYKDATIEVLKYDSNLL